MIKKLASLISFGLIFSFAMSACGSSLPEPPITSTVGQVAEGADVFGIFYAYLPTTAPQPPEILVLIHGTPPKGETAQANARSYITAWTGFAEQHGYLLLAPAFNQQDFSSERGDFALGGYRGLFGRKINADEWVLRLVRAYQRKFGSPNGQFYLYGHSAGGQFLARFLVVHPELVKRAVITSAATYPQPDPQVAWPFGLGELHTQIEWDAETTRQVDLVPDRQKWQAATQVPLTVIVGLNDTAELPPELIPGQKGKNRYTIARNWVAAMAAFAEANGLKSRFKLEIIPGQGHTMNGLLSYSQQALVSP